MASRDHALTDQCQAETVAPSLLPCPFCGGKPTVRVRSGAAGVRCVADDHFVQTYGADLPEAARAWNRRALSSAEQSSGRGPGTNPSNPKGQDQ